MRTMAGGSSAVTLTSAVQVSGVAIYILCCLLLLFALAFLPLPSVLATRPSFLSLSFALAAS